MQDSRGSYSVPQDGIPTRPVFRSWCFIDKIPARITSDNGKNMIKAIQILNDEATEQTLAEDDSCTGEVMEKLESIEIANVHLVRCAVHTLQLCVCDINKKSEIAEQISICRGLCKTLRTETHRRIIMDHKKSVPTLDVTTRWNSTYTMLKKLLDLKEFLSDKSLPSTIRINIDWDWVELYVDTFKAAFEATLKLQEEQLVYSDFFILWMELKLKCEKKQKSLIFNASRSTSNKGRI
ncbi:uncharacterized protein MFS17 isoform X7 [Drosophila takahashii]|uniref:uncharacterized protein MFS17 isoform X7 n=1 Tax=Drosophila takahashii TaxID=29030 RepID=UPI003898FACE